MHAHWFSTGASNISIQLTDAASSSLQRNAAKVMAYGPAGVTGTLPSWAFPPPTLPRRAGRAFLCVRLSVATSISVMAITGSCSGRVNYLTCKFLINHMEEGMRNVACLVTGGSLWAAMRRGGAP
jgi:hypothetical protein